MPEQAGAEALRPHFPVGESGPVTVLVQTRQRSVSKRRRDENRFGICPINLHLPGVQTVRSAEDPLGDYAPGEKPGIVSERATDAARAARPSTHQSDLCCSDARTGGQRCTL